MLIFIDIHYLKYFSSHHKQEKINTYTSSGTEYPLSSCYRPPDTLSRLLRKQAITSPYVRCKQSNIVNINFVEFSSVLKQREYVALKFPNYANFVKKTVQLVYSILLIKWSML
jgi:hypothetical protein